MLRRLRRFRCRAGGCRARRQATSSSLRVERTFAFILRSPRCPAHVASRSSTAAAAPSFRFLTPLSRSASSTQSSAVDAYDALNYKSYYFDLAASYSGHMAAGGLNATTKPAVAWFVIGTGTCVFLTNIRSLRHLTLRCCSRLQGGVTTATNDVEIWSYDTVSFAFLRYEVGNPLLPVGGGVAVSAAGPNERYAFFAGGMCVHRAPDA